MQIVSKEYLIAGDPNTTERTLRCLAASDNPSVRRRLAENANTPLDVLHALSHDPEPDVRAALTWNESLSLEILQILCADADVNVRLALAQGLNLPDSILNLLLEDENPYVKDRAELTHEKKSLETRLLEKTLACNPGEEAKLGELLIAAGFLDEDRLDRLMAMAINEQVSLSHLVRQEANLSFPVVRAALGFLMSIRRGQLSFANAIAQLSTTCLERARNSL